MTSEPRDWTNVRRVADPDEINVVLGRAHRVTASPSAMDEIRRRYPKVTESTPWQRFMGVPIHIDGDVPDGFAFAAGLLLDFREEAI